MRDYVESHYEDDYSEAMVRFWIEFCNEFGTRGDFDTWWGDVETIMYIWKIGKYTVVVDWDIWWSNKEEFLSFIEEMENYIIEENERVENQEKRIELLERQLAEAKEYLKGDFRF